MFSIGKKMFCVVIIAILAVAVNASADGKTYGSASCNVTSGTGLYWSAGSMGNSSAVSSLGLYCPATNDTGTGIESAWVMVLDQNDGDNVGCNLITRIQTEGGATGYSSSGYEYSSGYASTWQKLEFSTVSSSGDRSFYFSCSIPHSDIGYSYVGNYRIDE